MRKALWMLPALLLAVVAVLAPSVQGDVKAQEGERIVLAGDGEPGYSVNQFLPRDVTVAAGTTVTWEFPWFEPHIVAFVEGAPPEAPDVTENAVWPNEQGYVFSGDIFGNPTNPPTFSVTFPEVGSFTYFCPIHPLMTATVNVVEEGGESQAEIDARAAAEYAENIATVKASAAAAAAAGGTITPRQDGTNLIEVIVGSMDDAGNDGMQFFPPNVDLKTGDTIRWVTDVFTPHTVTFNIQDAPPFGDPFELAATPEETFAGEGFRNSGIMSLEDFGPNTVQSYELTFTGAGSFTYICILHADQGMVGKVNVSQRTEPTKTATATATATKTATKTATPSAPKAGSGTDSSGSNALLLVAAAGGLLLMSTGGLAAVALRRR